MCPNGNADLTRSLIVKSAINIISVDGLAALTAGRLIKQARISKGGLYHHFRTMNEVEEEVLEQLSTNLMLEINSYSRPSDLDEYVDLVEKQVFDLFATDSEASRALFGFVSATANRKQIKVTLRKLFDDISVTRFHLLQGLRPAVEPAKLQNVVQVIETFQMGLFCRFFIGEDLISLKNYWKNCRGAIEEQLGLHIASVAEKPMGVPVVTDLLKYQ